MKRLLSVLALGLFLPFTYSAEMVGIFADADITTTPIAGDIVGPLRFAAEDIKKTLMAQKYEVEILPLSSLTTSYPNKKIVLALASNTTAKNVLISQGGTAPAALGDQSYEMLTTSNGGTSYWAFGGDERGAMYGGLQLAENIQFEGFTKEQKGRVSPNILARGAKLNMAFDRRIPTYAGEHDTETPSIARGIEQAWSMDFWKGWIDQQARNRYNLLSVWNHSPFAALVNVPEFEKSTIDYIQGIKDVPGVTYFEDKSLTLAKRQQFWKDVMKYAKKRGFDFYFFNWNVCMEHVEDFYPVKGNDIVNATNKKYLNNAIYELLKTYPDLAGFGVSPGDAMPSSADQKGIAKWVFDAYAPGVTKFAQENKTRKITFIHRNLKVEAIDVVALWQKTMQDNQNLQFDHSLKYCMAYTYSTETPAWAKFDKQDMVDMGRSTFLTLRNDGFFYTDFGDSGFVRRFIDNLPPAKHVEGAHKGNDYLRGFYLGHDTYTPTRAYLFKDSELNNDPETGKPMLEIQRKWLMEMLWGRIGYDKNVSDDVFARGLAMRYPSLPSTSFQTLFQAWAKASQVNTKLMELVQGEWKLDSHFHTEFCMYKDDGEHYFRTLEHFWKGVLDNGEWKYPTPADGSEDKLASIKETGEGNKANKPNDSWKVAALLEKNGTEALTMLAGISTGGNKRTDALVKSIQTQALLSLFYAHYVRAATYLAVVPQKKTEAKNEMYKAYGWWIHYINTMESLYIAEDFRTYELKALGWRFWDNSVLKEYTNLGGIGTPALPKLPTAPTVPLITSSATPSATFGSLFNYQITASNSPTGFNASDLPKNLVVNTSNGLVSGTFAAAGSATFKVTATNGSGASLPVNVTVTVAKAVAAVTFTPSSLNVTADRNPKPVTVTTIPAGLTLLVNYTVNGASTTTAPSAPNTYPVSATISEANYQGNATAQLIIQSSGGGGVTPPPTTKPAVNDPASSTPTLSGTATPGAIIKIYDGTQYIGQTTADSSGNWTYTVNPPLSAGPHQLSFTVTEPSKSESAKSPTVLITVASGVTPTDPGSAGNNSSSCGLGSGLATFILLLAGFCGLLIFYVPKIRN